jgi:oligosaccharide reducing-end xylanase
MKATRDHIYNSANPQSGLCSDYSNFDGTPHHAYGDNSIKYAFDAIRCPMNYGMDSYLFGVDMERQTKIAKVITDFFEKDGYTHGHFNWDGTNGYGDFTIGQAGANAVATYALLKEDSYKDLVKKVLQKAWDSKPIVGSQRYYDGLVHFLAMLHLTGNFKIWKPKPTVESEEKTIDETEINGVTYNAGDKVDYFEGCKLYKATVVKKSAPGPDSTVTPQDSVTTPDSTIAIGASVALNNNVRVWSNGISLFVENAPANTKIVVADLNGRVLKSARVTSANQEIRLNNKGPMLVMVGKKSYTVIK